MSVSNCGVETSYIAELTNNVAINNWRYYQDRVIEKARRYQLKQLIMKIKEWSKTLNSSEIIEKIESEIIQITADVHTKKIEKINKLMFKVIEEIEHQYHSKGKIPGISTGLSNLDTFTLGFEKSKLYYIGARPSNGKTAVMLNIAMHIALNGKRVGMFSLESGYIQLIKRVLASEGRINSVNISTGYLRESDFGKLMDVCNRVQNSELYLYDKANIDLSELIIQTRRMITMYQVDIIFIDYLQLITGGAGDKEHERIANISITLKGLAREHNIPVVCLAQLRRDADNRRPGLGDFYGSSQIEKDADIAMLIYHKKEKDETIKSYFLIDKNRDGQTGIIPIVFEKEYVSFREKTRGV
jgi:replicative DNA helicase